MLPVPTPPASQTRVVRGARVNSTCSALLWSVNHWKMAHEPGHVKNAPLDDDEEDTGPPPPDGGWGWVIVFGSFMIHIVSKWRFIWQLTSFNISHPFLFNCFFNLLNGSTKLNFNYVTNKLLHSLLLLAFLIETISCQWRTGLVVSCAKRKTSWCQLRD